MISKKLINTKILNRKENSILTSTNVFNYIKTKHSWHLVDPSPWPIIAALAAFTIPAEFESFLNGTNFDCW